MMPKPNTSRTRALHRTQRKEPEEVKIDLDAPLDSNLNEILRNLVQSGPAARSYLQPLVKLAPSIVLSHHRDDGKMGMWNLLKIFCCVRLVLVDEETEVKAEALRVLRHLTASESTFEVMCRALIPSLVVKSLDIVLDNKVERLQALRLMRRCSTVAPLKFPLEFAYCILAVANDGATERDNFAKACVATAGELCISNPRLWLSAGTFMTLVRSVLSSNVSEPRAAESLVSTLMYFVNSPKTRHMMNADLGLEYLISPFTDRNFEVHPDDQMFHQEREMKARIAICSILRSWPGLIYLCSEQSGLTKLIELLRVPDTETQRSVMDLFFDLFCLQTPEWTTDFRIALLAADDKTGLQRGWLLYEGFVAAEGADLMPPISRSVNLSSCYLALLLQAMVMHGLLDAVAEATVADEEQISIHATVLLAELLHMCSRLFPHDASHMCHLLPGLIDATMSPDMNIRLKATSVINRLAYIEKFKCMTIGVPTSLNLDQQFLFCQQAKNERSSAESRSASLQSTKGGDTLKRKKAHRKTNTQNASLDNLFHKSGVFGAEFEWDVVKCLLKQPEFEEDPQAVRFLEKLIAFYMPSNRKFSAIETEREQARNMCSALLVLADFFLEKLPDNQLLDDLVTDVCNCLKQIQGENIPPNSVLSPAKASSTLSQAYFLLIGRLTGSVQGLYILKKAAIFEQLTKLLVTSPSAASTSYNDVYIKLALSPLNYTTSGPSRELFKHVITSNSSESARIYCVNLLKMLIRFRLTDMSRWVIELLVECLVDDCVAVKATAYDVLNEACDVVDNLDALIALNPTLKTESEDQAWMLQLRYFSRTKGLALLDQKGMIEHEINRWRSTGALKYVKWVEYSINQSVSRHRRGADGKYGRRHSSEHKLHRLRQAFCPPHLLGQLASHAPGIDIIRDRDLIEPLCETIRKGNMDTPTLVFYMKAALWGVGHLCKTPAGLKLVQEQNILHKVVELAKTSNVLSLRGTAFYCLCLASVTGEGCDILSAMGWEGVRQSVAGNELYATRRSESVDSQWSLDSSWTSVHEFRDRASSTRDSISFDDISLANTENMLSIASAANPPSTWTFTDMRKMMHCYTSQADASGYGTLKLLRPKRRYQSSGDAPPPTPDLLIPSKDDASCIPSVLVGLVLPRHINSIFNRDFLAIEKALPPSTSDLPRESFGTVHKRETCLRCGDSSWEEDGIASTTRAASSEAVPERSSNASTESKETPTSPLKVTTQDREQARNDLLRYVINLAAVYPNSNKAVEQLLLSMKQKQPWVFSDLCLFSDCCHLMRIFQLRQPFRKFLQELFMDVNFGEFRSRAEAIVKKATAFSVNAIRETICEDDEEVCRTEQKDLQREQRRADANNGTTSVKSNKEQGCSYTNSGRNRTNADYDGGGGGGGDERSPTPASAHNVNNDTNQKGHTLNNGQREETDQNRVTVPQQVEVTTEQNLPRPRDPNPVGRGHCHSSGAADANKLDNGNNGGAGDIGTKLNHEDGSAAKGSPNLQTASATSAPPRVAIADTETAKNLLNSLEELSSKETTPQANSSLGSSTAPDDKDQNGDIKEFSVNRRRRRRRKSGPSNNSNIETNEIKQNRND